MTAPVGDDPTWLDDLREQVAEFLAGEKRARPWAQYSDVAKDIYRGRADALLSGPLAVPTLIAELRKRDAALKAVLDKHRPIGGPSHFDGDESDYCDDDGFIWPCSTYRALTAALTPESVTT